MLKEMNINVKYAFLFLGFVRELLSNTTRSAKFWWLCWATGVLSV
jgi:hypothetical protein